MNWTLFKKTKTPCIITMVLSTLVLIILTGIGWLNTILMMLLLLIDFFTIFIIFEIKAQKLFDAIDKHRQDCRAGKALREYEGLLIKAKNPALGVIQNNMFATCFTMGDFKRAEYLINSISPNYPENSAGLLSKCIYYQNLACLYTETDRLEEAEVALDTAKGFINNPKLNREHRDTAQKHWMKTKSFLDLAKGEYEGLQKYFENEFEISTTLLSKVTNKVGLAEIYVHYGENEKAKESCDYVIENGGDTRYVAEAKAILERL